MIHRRTAQRTVLWRLSAALAAMSATGCSPPDQWTVFAPAAPLLEEDHLRPPQPAERIAMENALPERVATPDPWPFGAAPDAPIPLTIEQASIHAISSNRDLRVERLTPVIVASFEDIERGVFDPELFARGEFFKDEADEISRATEESFAVTREDTLAEGGVRQRLPSGTDVELGLSTNRSTSNRSPDQQVVRAGLTVTQALLRGFDPAVNLARIQQAELDTLASLYQLQGFTESLLAETEIAYWSYALAAQRIRIFEQSLELARRQAREVEQRIEIGVLPPTETAAARAEVAQREQDLIDARSELETLRLRLLRLLNAPEEEWPGRRIDAATDPAMETFAIDDLDDRLALAVRARPDVREARLRLEQQRLETVITRNGRLPRLDFFIAVGKTGYADSFSAAVREIDGSTFDLTVGLEFSYPLGNRVAEGRDKGARASRAQAAEAVANLEQLVRLDVRLAAAESERARRQIAASSATRALREEALRAENERFRVGDSTSLLVAQAQRDLLESRINEIDAIVAYRIALINLYLAEGTLLSRRGLTVEAPGELQASRPH